jgi:hypothetical protein
MLLDGVWILDVVRCGAQMSNLGHIASCARGVSVVFAHPMEDTAQVLLRQL